MPLDNITELRKRVPGGKYALARALAERARQLQNGATPLTEVRTPNPLSVAIDEIIQGKISFEITENPVDGAEEEAAVDETAGLLTADAAEDSAPANGE